MLIHFVVIGKNTEHIIWYKKKNHSGFDKMQMRIFFLRLPAPDDILALSLPSPKKLCLLQTAAEFHVCPWLHPATQIGNHPLSPLMQQGGDDFHLPIK